MKTRIVTLMWGTAWERYGKAFCESYTRHWPWQSGGTSLCVIGDRHGLPIGDVPGLLEFGKRNDNARARGLESKDHKAKPGERFWKHDALKWAPQAMTPLLALDGLENGGLKNGDLLAWFDADVEFIADVPTGWINVLLDGHDLVHLGRAPQHSEIGFWAIRVGNKTRAFVKEFSDIYASDRVFDYPEWHSGFIFDRARENVPGIKTKSLSEGKGHVWPQTVLAKYTVHKKGKLKEQ